MSCVVGTLLTSGTNGAVRGMEASIRHPCPEYCRGCAINDNPSKSGRIRGRSHKHFPKRLKSRPQIERNFQNAALFIIQRSTMFEFRLRNPIFSPRETENRNALRPGCSG